MSEKDPSDPDQLLENMLASHGPASGELDPAARALDVDPGAEAALETFLALRAQPAPPPPEAPDPVELPGETKAMIIQAEAAATYVGPVQVTQSEAPRLPSGPVRIKTEMDPRRVKTVRVQHAAAEAVARVDAAAKERAAATEERVRVEASAVVAVAKERAGVEVLAVAKERAGIEAAVVEDGATAGVGAGVDAVVKEGATTGVGEKERAGAADRAGERRGAVRRVEATRAAKAAADDDTAGAPVEPPSRGKITADSGRDTLKRGMWIGGLAVLAAVAVTIGLLGRRVPENENGATATASSGGRVVGSASGGSAVVAASGARVEAPAPSMDATSTTTGTGAGGAAAGATGAASAAPSLTSMTGGGGDSASASPSAPTVASAKAAPKGTDDPYVDASAPTARASAAPSVPSVPPAAGSTGAPVVTAAPSGAPVATAVPSATARPASTTPKPAGGTKLDD